MIEISLNNKEQYNHPKQQKEPKHNEKTSNNLDHKLARPYSKDPSNLKQSVIKWVSILFG